MKSGHYHTFGVTAGESHAVRLRTKEAREKLNLLNAWKRRHPPC
jgi:hypothetical protein